MFETLLEYFQGTPLSLWGPFGLLLLCGLGLPIPEDIVLIVAGALGEMDGRNWIRVSMVMYIGVLGGDSMIFFAGRYLGTRLLASSWLQRILPSRKQIKVEGLMERYGSMALFIGRFLPGLRAPIFFTAGSMKVSFVKFLFFDGLAALASVPIFVWVGRWLWAEFSENLEEMHEALARTHEYSLWCAMLLAVIAIAGVWLWARRSRRAA
ncbi:MAG: rane protein [Verrucomicrobia bacterium]|nr:rane protein [Verrucomicrobiota bacterium]